uniref:Uncharacterized protein n=1 Tax=Anguilla anguilla TaxID=7936 RepID=A0A0E9PNP5_ANGAN
MLGIETVGKNNSELAPAWRPFHHLVTLVTQKTGLSNGSPSQNNTFPRSFLLF